MKTKKSILYYVRGVRGHSEDIKNLLKSKYKVVEEAPTPSCDNPNALYYLL